MCPQFVIGVWRCGIQSALNPKQPPTPQDECVMCVCVCACVCLHVCVSKAHKSVKSCVTRASRAATILASQQMNNNNNNYSHKIRFRFISFCSVPFFLFYTGGCVFMQGYWWWRQRAFNTCDFSARSTRVIFHARSTRVIFSARSTRVIFHACSTRVIFHLVVGDGWWWCR